MFRWFSSVWRKIIWVAKLVYTFVSPIYQDIIDVIRIVKDEGLQDDAAKARARELLKSILEVKGISIPDSIINAAIDIFYLLTKNGRA